MFSRDLESTLNRALCIAGKYRHEYATFEHLLLALIDDADAKSVLQHYKANLAEMTQDLEIYLSEELTYLIDKKTKEVEPTTGFQRIVHRAAVGSNTLAQSEVTGANLLAEFFFEHECYATTCLKEQNITRPQILQFLQENYANEINLQLAENHTTHQTDIQTPHFQAKTLSTLLQSKDKERIKNHANDKIIDELDEEELTKYCTNLNQQASSGKIDNLVGRDEEITRTMEILCRRHKNNPLLVGEPGVGKTAIAEGLALRIVRGEVPDWLADHVVYSLDLASIVSGTKYRGDFEERIKNILDLFRNNQNAILFVDEIHMLMGMGAGASGAMDASNMLKPALARGEIRCIGATTFHEYHSHFEHDAALTRRFQKIIIDEPTPEEALEILHGLKKHYEQHHNTKYSDDALEAAIELSEKYIHDKNLPDKAIELIDDAGARKKIISDAQSVITKEDIQSTISAIAHIPSLIGGELDLNNLQSLESNLKAQIFGQDHAIEQLCASIKMSKAGLRAHTKPIGAYLFAGTTGVGKTELSKKLAKLSGMKLTKFDMSEYSESHSVSRLIGAPPGYVGSNRGGLLTESIRKNPHAVILFDEIEKAHPDIYNLLLQMIDEGQLTDSTGKNAICTHSIIIFTSNVSADKLETNSIGFTQQSAPITSASLDQIHKTFPAEFCSRLDDIIVFNKVGVEVIASIVQQALNKLSTQLADKKVKLIIDPKLQKYLQDTMLNNLDTGMRAMQRVIDTKIKRRCAEEILFGKLKNGGVITITEQKGEPFFIFK